MAVAKKRKPEPVKLSRKEWGHIALLIGVRDASPCGRGVLDKIGWTGKLAAQNGVAPCRKSRLPKIEQKVWEMLAGSCEDVVGPRYLQGYENALEAVLKLFEEE